MLLDLRASPLTSDLLDSQGTLPHLRPRLTAGAVQGSLPLRAAWTASAEGPLAQYEAGDTGPKELPAQVLDHGLTSPVAQDTSSLKHSGHK